MQHVERKLIQEELTRLFAIEQPDGYATALRDRLVQLLQRLARLVGGLRTLEDFARLTNGLGRRVAAQLDPGVVDALDQERRRG
jgi:hypothetical protein